MRTLRQIPKVVGQTDAGETIYQARSARLVLRGDAAHFNRLVRCAKCGREVPGRAVLGPADLEQPAQAVVCNACVEAATEMSSPPGPLAEPVAVDEPAVADAQAEMDMGPEEVVDELGGPPDDEAEAPDELESEETEVGEFVEEPDEVAPAEEELPPVNLQLMDDVAGLGDEEPPAPEEDEVLTAGASLDEMEAPAPADDEVLGGLEEVDEPPPPDDEASTADAGLVEYEPPAPEEDAPLLIDAGLDEYEPPAPVTAAPAFVDVRPDDDEPPAPEEDEPVLIDAGLDEYEPPAPVTAAPAFVDVRPDDDGMARRVEALEERLAAADHPDARLVALEETVNYVAESADAQANVHVAMQAQMDELRTAVAAQGKKESDKVRRRLEQMGERLDHLQATIDVEWARSKSETATLSQTITDLGERVLRLAEQAGDTAGAEDERLAAVEEKVDEVTARLGDALAAVEEKVDEEKVDAATARLADALAAVEEKVDATTARLTDALAAVEEKVDATTARLADALESQRRELQEGLREGRAEVVSTAPSTQPAQEQDPSRLAALERQVQHGQDEVSELHELHAALDAGLGALRGELAEVRDTLARTAGSQADVVDRLETFVRMSLVPEGTQGRKAKKTAESTMGTLSAAVQDLLREQRQLKDAIAALEQASDAATAAATRASMNASSLGPLRSDIKALHQEIQEHNQELEALRRAVAQLRQPAAEAPKAAPPKAPTPAKVAKAPAAKAPAAKGGAPAKRAAAKAAVAKAGATQTGAAKAAATKRAPRAKKA